MKKACSLFLALCLLLAALPAAAAADYLPRPSEEDFANAARAMGMGEVLSLTEDVPDLGLSYAERYAEFPAYGSGWYFGSIQWIRGDDPARAGELADAFFRYYLDDYGFVTQSVRGENYQGLLCAVDAAHTHFTPRFSAVLQIEDVILVLDFSELEDLRAAMNVLGCGGVSMGFLENYDDVQYVTTPVFFDMAMANYGYSLTADASGQSYRTERAYSAGIRGGTYDALCVQARDAAEAEAVFYALYGECNGSSPVSLGIHNGDNYSSVWLYEPGFLLRVEDTVYLVCCESADIRDQLLEFLDFRLR